MKVLVINCGSSSIKYKLYDMDNEHELCNGLLERIGFEDAIANYTKTGCDKEKQITPIKDYETGIQIILDTITHPEKGVIKNVNEINAVGHRVVHGAETFSGSQLLTQEVIDKMKECIPLAPLHNPPNLGGIAAFQKLLPNVPQCGVFDTAFHQTMPEEAYIYAIPYELYEKHRIRRYGFHGTSHYFVANEAATFLKKPIESLKIVTCHLGNGCSVCAVDRGKSVDTSMGMTPLEGLVMGTRCGDIDPALIKFIMEKENLDIDGVDKLLNKKSGLHGICGSHDSRDVDEGMIAGKRKETLAFNIMARRITKYIGAYAAIMGGIDALVFTAGIGENSEHTRGKVCETLSFLGIELDYEKNIIRSKDARDISSSKAKIPVLVIPTNEELVIARDTKKIVKQAAPASNQH
ncbi:MAG TPA: acetate kinase [Caldisericia bacterium]|nr:acetate kinase [Caldisericia bacterium]HPF49083.1 acetate kinase [Caldisericia bacterium]HPI83053.1 acetate kinase [Caldisericia bacterium]HPQ92280.1 acetate kinase [Caldisericia bacterium]HRV74622.1 acetate kinase [Caldisericia bacterium]